jgi:5-methylcytosine-specific restriction protein A
MQSRLSTQPPRVRAPAKVAEPFYLTAEWHRLKARRRLDPDYFAAKARAKHGERLILDHVRERKDGGSDLDPSNTEWLTNSEHQAKTAKARARRAQGRA